MTFNEWVSNQGLSDSEVFYAKSAWNAAILESIKVLQSPHWKPVVRNELNKKILEISTLKIVD